MNLQQLRLDYEAGVISITELAARHNLTDQQVRNTAARFSWQRRTPNLPVPMVLVTIDVDEMEDQIWDGVDPAEAKHVFTTEEIDYRAQLTAGRIVQTRANDINKLRQSLMNHLDQVNNEGESMPPLGGEPTLRDLAQRSLIRSKQVETVGRIIGAYESLSKQENELYVINAQEAQKSNTGPDKREDARSIMERLNQLADERSAYTNFEGDVFDSIEQDKLKVTKK